MIEMLEIEFLLRMVGNTTSMIELGRNACLNIRVDLAAPEKLIDLIDRHEMRPQPNIG